MKSTGFTWRNEERRGPDAIVKAAATGLIVLPAVALELLAVRQRDALPTGCQRGWLEAESAAVDGADHGAGAGGAACTPRFEPPLRRARRGRQHLWMPTQGRAGAPFDERHPTRSRAVFGVSRSVSG